MSTSLSHGQAWVYLDTARAVEQIGSLDMLRNMLPMLQELLDRDLPQIERFLADGDVRSANPLLHSLKGCVPIFCASALCDQLAQVEFLSKAGGAAEVGAAYAQLGPKLHELQHEVVRYLAQP